MDEREYVEVPGKWGVFVNNPHFTGTKYPAFTNFGARTLRKLHSVKRGDKVTAYKTPPGHWYLMDDNGEVFWTGAVMGVDFEMLEPT